MTAFTIALPPEWETAPFASIDPVAHGQLEDGQALLASVLLADGTNIMAVTWPGGQRVARMGMPTDWAVQEHYTGELPPGAGAAVVERMWRAAVAAMVQGKADTIAEMPAVAAALGLKARPA